MFFRSRKPHRRAAREVEPRCRNLSVRELREQQARMLDVYMHLR